MFCHCQAMCGTLKNATLLSDRGIKKHMCALSMFRYLPIKEEKCEKWFATQKGFNYLKACQAHMFEEW